MTSVNDLEFLKAYHTSLVDIDPDSPRHIDWLYSLRAQVGLDTSADIYEFPNTKGRYVIEDIIRCLPVITEHTSKRVYSSPALYRAYYIQDGVPLACVVVTRAESNCTVSAIGDATVVSSVIESIKANFVIPNTITITNLFGFTEHGPATRVSEVRSDDPRIYLSSPEFYPTIKNDDGSMLDFDQLAKDFNKSRSSLMILIGPPGTGKTTFLRTLMWKMGKDNNVSAMGENTILDPSFMGFLHQTEDSTLITVEDADKLCAPRSDDNIAMSSLLGFCDGVDISDQKIIISTNLAGLNKVDPALIRDGRAFKVIEFGYLTPEQGNDARVAIGLPVIDLEGHKQLTLAKALNAKEGLVGNRTATPVGFGV